MKKLCSLIAGILVISLLSSFTFFKAEAETGFTDVSGRYEESVEYIIGKEYAQGINQKQYGTTNPIKRIDAAVMVARVMGFSDSTISPTTNFTDVPVNRSWAVDALKNAGVINGKTATTFGSSQSMSRSEMAKMLAEAYQLSASTDKIPFTDVNPRFQSAVAALVESEITFGKTDTKFGADDNVTRGEFALFIYRADQLAIDKTPPEVISVE